MDLPHVRFIGRSIPLYASMSRSITIHIDTLNKFIQSTLSVVTRQSESGANTEYWDGSLSYTHMNNLDLSHYIYRDLDEGLCSI